jgi:hypothetical protein
MAATTDFAPLVAELVAIMKRAAPGMVVAQEGPDGLMMHAPWPHPAKPKEPMFFGGVRGGLRRAAGPLKVTRRRRRPRASS